MTTLPGTAPFAAAVLASPGDEVALSALARDYLQDHPGERGAAVEAVHAHLDRHPGDHWARLVMAGVLGDDPTAEGWRALSAGKRAPFAAHGWTWGEYSVPGKVDYSWLHGEWYREVAHIAGHPHNETLTELGAWCHFPSRRAADEAACLAFTRLPPDRRAELLGTPQ